jgi:hypothetical protein
MTSHLSILDLAVKAMGVQFRNFSPCSHIFKDLPHFLLDKFQYLWFYVDFLYLLAFIVSGEKSAVSLIGLTLYVT